MKLIKKLISNFLIYKILAFFESIYVYAKDYNLISDTLYSDHFKFIIKQYLKCDIDKDWLGRLYGIINPNIDINGKLDVNNIVIEIDDNNTNSEEYVKNWIYRQMQLISSLFKIEKLYDYISMSVTHVGPQNHDNFLIVFDITSRKYMAYCFKRMMKHTLLYAIIAFIIVMFIL